MSKQASLLKTIELPVKGMDCSGCVDTVKKSLKALLGVADVSVSLGEERAIVRLDPSQVSLDTLRETLEDLGYEVLR